MEMIPLSSRKLPEIPWNPNSIPAVSLEKLAEWNTVAGSLQG
jgi:hypothetical protein